MGMWPAMWCYAIGHRTGTLEGLNDVDQYEDWRSAYADFATSWFDHFQGYCPDIFTALFSVIVRLLLWCCDQLGTVVLGLPRWLV